VEQYIENTGWESMTSDEKSDFDKMVESIQKEIDKDAEATFSKKVIREYKNPQNVGRMKDPDSVAIITGSCGDTMEIFLKIQENKIMDIQFMTDGCGPSIACGSMVTKIVKGKTIDKVNKITDIDLLKALDGLPDENKHCAKLAVDTLQKAIKNYLTELGK